MITVKYKCDECGLEIDGKTSPEKGNIREVGGASLCTLMYSGEWGNNQFSTDKHYHGYCFTKVVERINQRKRK